MHNNFHDCDFMVGATVLSVLYLITLAFVIKYFVKVILNKDLPNRAIQQAFLVFLVLNCTARITFFIGWIFDGPRCAPTFIQEDENWVSYFSNVPSTFYVSAFSLLVFTFAKVYHKVLMTDPKHDRIFSSVTAFLLFLNVGMYTLCSSSLLSLYFHPSNALIQQMFIFYLTVSSSMVAIMFFSYGNVLYISVGLLLQDSAKLRQNQEETLLALDIHSDDWNNNNNTSVSGIRNEREDSVTTQPPSTRLATRTQHRHSMTSAQATSLLSDIDLGLSSKTTTHADLMAREDRQRAFDAQNAVVAVGGNNNVYAQLTHNDSDDHLSEIDSVEHSSPAPSYGSYERSENASSSGQTNNTESNRYSVGGLSSNSNASATALTQSKSVLKNVQIASKANNHFKTLQIKRKSGASAKNKEHTRGVTSNTYGSFVVLRQNAPYSPSLSSNPNLHQSDSTFDLEVGQQSDQLDNSYSENNYSESGYKDIDLNGDLSSSTNIPQINPMLNTFRISIISCVCFLARVTLLIIMNTFFRDQGPAIIIIYSLASEIIPVHLMLLVFNNGTQTKQINDIKQGVLLEYSNDYQPPTIRDDSNGKINNNARV